jgi:diaminohydroxyphosphoribosylaminopyrimidine deaminase / 5-amino-6-(5-phosphoribosylamino)uracil reductase
VTATATPVATDRAHLARAVAVAATAVGRTAPNPAVGCVLVRDGEVVGQGATTPAGGPHAEVVAIAAAGDRARGATAYVTLEPCAHHGRTAPCTVALRAAEVARVVIAHRDPHLAAAGGAAELEAAGIPVAVDDDGPVRDAVADQLEGFLTTVTRGRPHLTLKLAQTRDGALSDPRRRWLTGPRTRAAVHAWRRRVDAVLVGSGTVVADDPGLDVRDVPLGDRPQPRPVVLDARLRTPATARVVARGALVVTVPQAPAASRRSLADAGAEVVSVRAAASGGVDLDAAVAALRDHGVTSVLAEPGRTLATALLTADAVDRLLLHVALDLGDGPAAPAVTVDPTAWRTTRLGGVGGDLVWERVRVTAADRRDPEVR